MDMDRRGGQCCFFPALLLLLLPLFFVFLFLLLLLMLLFFLVLLVLLLSTLGFGSVQPRCAFLGAECECGDGVLLARGMGICFTMPRTPAVGGSEGGWWLRGQSGR